MTPLDSGMWKISDSRIFLWVSSEHTKWPSNDLTQIALFFFFSEAVYQRCSVKKVFLEISENSQENTVNFVKFLRTPFLTEHLRRLLLFF